MLAERVLGSDASYLRRLGALSCLLCGAVALLGMVLVVLRPAPDNLLALLACVCLAASGAAVAHGH